MTDTREFNFFRVSTQSVTTYAIPSPTFPRPFQDFTNLPQQFGRFGSPRRFLYVPPAHSHFKAAAHSPYQSFRKVSYKSHWHYSSPQPPAALSFRPTRRHCSTAYSGTPKQTIGHHMNNKAPRKWSANSERKVDKETTEAAEALVLLNEETSEIKLQSSSTSSTRTYELRSYRVSPEIRYAKNSTSTKELSLTGVARRQNSNLSFDSDDSYLSQDYSPCPSPASLQKIMAPDSREKEEWHTGHTLLALPEDEDSLSPLHCFIRKHCIEAFAATDEDTSLPRYGKSFGSSAAVDGRVGIRCLYCKNKSVQDRAERSVCFPSSVENIYHSMETWHRRHSKGCAHIPGWVKRKMTELMKSSRSRAGGRRQYWAQAARRLHMCDTPYGVRFTRDPNCESLPEEDQNDEKKPSKPHLAASCLPLVSPHDKELITDYLFLIMDQMKVCEFSEEDRAGGRSKVKDIPVGFPGMECKHCSGRAGMALPPPGSRTKNNAAPPIALDAPLNDEDAVITALNNLINTINHPITGLRVDIHGLKETIDDPIIRLADLRADIYGLRNTINDPNTGLQALHTSMTIESARNLNRATIRGNEDAITPLPNTAGLLPVAANVWFPQNNQILFSASGNQGVHLLFTFYGLVVNMVILQRNAPVFVIMWGSLFSSWLLHAPNGPSYQHPISRVLWYY